MNCPQCGAPCRPSTPADGPGDDFELFPWCCDGCGILCAEPYVEPRPAAEVLTELREANASAKRLNVVHPNYGPTHSLINELLTELEEATRG
jgi:hypothetical protein